MPRRSCRSTGTSPQDNTIARQCLDLGLLDEVSVDLVPVGEGNRPFFGQLSSEDVMLGNPKACVRVTGSSISCSQ